MAKSGIGPASPRPTKMSNGATATGSVSCTSIQACAATSAAPGAFARAAVTSAWTAAGTTIRLASLGSNPSWPMRASPISGLLSAMMSSSAGTQFGFDFLVVQIHDGHLHPAQFVRKPNPVPPGQFGSFAERKLADLEEPDGQLELHFPLDFDSRLAARDQQIVGYSSVTSAMDRL